MWTGGKFWFLKGKGKIKIAGILENSAALYTSGEYGYRPGPCQKRSMYIYCCVLRNFMWKLRWEDGLKIAVFGWVENAKGLLNPRWYLVALSLLEFILVHSSGVFTTVSHCFEAFIIKIPQVGAQSFCRVTLLHRINYSDWELTLCPGCWWDLVFGLWHVTDDTLHTCTGVFRCILCCMIQYCAYTFY